MDCWPMSLQRVGHDSATLTFTFFPFKEGHCQAAVHTGQRGLQTQNPLASGWQHNCAQWRLMQ